MPVSGTLRAADGRTKRVTFQEPPTQEQVDEATRQVFGEAPPEPDEETFIDSLFSAENAARVVGGTVGGIISAVPSPLTTLTGAAIGAAGETVAQGIEQAKGTREGFNLGTIGVEAALTAIPGGKLVAGGRVAAAAGKEALKIGAAEAVGAQARSLLETGEFASPTETLVAGGAGALGGALGGASTQRALTKDAAEEAAAAAALAERRSAAQAARAAKKAAQKAAPGEQIELFDAAGEVKPGVREFSDVTTEGSTARGGRMVTRSILKEGEEAHRLLAETDSALKGERAYRQLGELLERGQLEPDESLIEELADRGLSIQDYIKDFWMPSVRRGAQQMQQLSEVVKTLKAKGLIDDETAALLAQGKSNRVLDFVQKLDDTRRGLLITQVRTGVRNAITQGAAAVGDLLEAGLTDGIGGMRAQFEGFARALSRKESGAAVDQLLKHRLDLRKKMGSLDFRPPSFVDDVAVLKGTIGRLTEVTTFANRWQEMFFRHAKFDAVLRKGLKEAGVDALDAFNNPKLIPEGLLDDAVEQALELTFASSNPGGLGRIINGIQLSRPLFTLIAPFPRYMANAATYIAKHNPLGLVRLATKGGRKNARKVLAEAAVGTAFMGGGLGLRLSPFAGEKWYEIKTGPDDDDRFDIRGFAGPFAGYLFLGEAFKQYAQKGVVEFSAGDVFEGILSMNRLGGTLANISRQLNKEGAGGVNEFLTNLAADWTSGFATPLKTFSDLMAIGGAVTGVEALKGESTLRDIRGLGLVGKLQQSVPGARQALPAAINPLTGEERRTENPTTFALLGLNQQKRTAVEQEVNRLGLQNRDILPSTGEAKIDRALGRRIGKLVQLVGPRVFGNPAYQALRDADKIVEAKKIFRWANKVARKDLEKSAPELAAVLKGKRKLTKDVTRQLEARGLDPQGALGRLIESSPEE